MTKKINAQNIGILALSTTTLSAAIGIAISYPLHIMYPHSNINILFNMSALFCLIHTPLAFVAQDSLRHELGWKSPIKIIGNSFSKRTGRKIPFSANGKDSNILMSSIPWLNSDNIEEPETESFTVRIGDIDYTVTLVEMESFIRAAWNRQRAGTSGLSRTYWTRDRRPRLKTLEYNARMIILSSVPGLILDRSQGRSGRLAISPLLAMDALA